MNKDYVKLCKQCNIIKPLAPNFYRAGASSYQKLCKICHNENRKRYKRNFVCKYIPKPKKLTGFQKLDKNIKNNILRAIEVKTSYREISQAYGIKYVTLMSWKNKGLLY